MYKLYMTESAKTIFSLPVRKARLETSVADGLPIDSMPLTWSPPKRQPQSPFVSASGRVTLRSVARTMVS